MPPPGLPVRIVGGLAPLCACALAALNLTCARPIAAGSSAQSAPVSSSAGAAADDGTVAALPSSPKPTPTTEHPELRALGKPIAHHVERGFETLILSTAENVRCEGGRVETGAEVRIQGG